MDLYRRISKGGYYTNFDFLNDNKQFPSLEVQQRNAVYKYMQRLYDGSYANNIRLEYYHNGIAKTYPYKVAGINYYKTIVNKVDALLFNNDIVIRSGNTATDTTIQNLIERTQWLKGIRRAIRQAEIYGDVFLKTFKTGVSSICPTNAFCVVDQSNVQRTLAFVLHEFLYSKGKQSPDFIRLEIHLKGVVYESVRRYTGTTSCGCIGEPVDYIYHGRQLSKQGNAYNTGCDTPLIQKLSINQDADGVYGQSSFFDITSLVNLLELRLSSEAAILNAHEKPILCVDLANTSTNEQTGKRQLKMVDNDILITSGNSSNPEYVTWDGKLDNSKQFRDDVLSYIYQLSELGEAFMTGKYQGNPSEESLNNIIKSAIDRCNRDLSDMWYEIRASLYTLCVLNGVGVNEGDLSVTFNVGRTDDAKTTAEIAKTLIDCGVMSKATILERYFGLDKDAAKTELEQVEAENTSSKPEQTLDNIIGGTSDET